MESLLDFTKICRLCLCDDRPLSQIFSYDENIEISLLSTASKISACVSIEVQPGDNLPDKICNKCIEQLENWVKFKELCDNSNTLLLEYGTGIPPLSDEILQKNLEGSNIKCLDIPETSSDFCLEDVSLLEHDSLFQKYDESRHEDLPNSESLVHNSFTGIFLENCKNSQKDQTNEEELKKQAEEEDLKATNRCKWREKYSRVYVRKYNCGICSKVFTRFTNLLQHDLIEHKDIVPKDICSNCGKLFISKLRLDNHNYLMHKEKQFECEICGLKSVSEKSLKIHKVKHTDRFKCNICSKVMSSGRSLQEHLKVHSKESVYSCKLCLRSFKYNQSLQDHLKTHETQCVQCDICLRKFTKVQYLKKHMSLHGMHKSVICEICGVVLRNETTLRAHTLIHKEKQHSCSVCDKIFSTKGLVKRHMRTHGLPFFVCEICNKAYNRADTLSMHMKTHSGMHSYSCQQCDQSFTLNKYLKRHIARIHSKEDNEEQEENVTNEN